MSLFKLATAVGPFGTNRLIGSIIGGGLLGAGSSLISKKQKDHIIRNSVIGALLGGLGYTGYATRKANKLKKDFLKKIEQEYLPKVEEQVWKGEKVDKIPDEEVYRFKRNVGDTLPFQKWRESFVDKVEKNVESKVQKTKERVEDAYERAVSGYIDKWLKDSYKKSVESLAYEKALFDLSIPLEITKSRFKNSIKNPDLRLEIPLPRQDKKIIRKKLLHYMDLHGYKPQGDPLYETSEFLEHIAEPEAQKIHLALKNKAKAIKR